LTPRLISPFQAYPELIEKAFALFLCGFPNIYSAHRSCSDVTLPFSYIKHPASLVHHSFSDGGRIYLPIVKKLVVICLSAVSISLGKSVQLVLSRACPEKAEALSLCPRCASEVSAEWVEWIPGVKIGKIFRQFSIKNADTSEQKSKFFKIFNLLSQIELRATSNEKRLHFRNKSAGSSNYRGSVFLLPEFTRVYPRVYLHGFSAGDPD